MKYFKLLITILLFTSCTSLSRFIEIGSEYIEIDKPKLRFSSSKIESKTINTLLIELPNTLQLPIEQDPDTNFILQPINHKLTPNKQGVTLVYNDTISFFNPKTFTEKVKIIKREIPIKILEAN